MVGSSEAQLDPQAGGNVLLSDSEPVFSAVFLAFKALIAVLLAFMAFIGVFLACMAFIAFFFKHFLDFVTVIDFLIDVFIDFFIESGNMREMR